MRSLVKVREWKERLEETARAERLAVEARAAELAREADRMRAARRVLPDAGPEDAPHDDLAAWSRHAEWLGRRELRLRDTLAAMQEEIAAKREAHLRLCRDVESLKRLEERRERALRRLRERKAQELLDDAAARRFLPGTGTKFPAAAPAEHPHTRPGTGETAAEAALPARAR